MCWCDSRKQTPWCDECRPLAPTSTDILAVTVNAPKHDVRRRHDHERQTQAEAAIADAVRLVEELPSDPRLTSALVMLARAKERVADFVDGVI